MIRLKIYEKEYGTPLKALVNEDTKESLADGVDNDEMNGYINGFLSGLDFAKVEYELLDTESINMDNKMYFICGFDKWWR